MRTLHPGLIVVRISGWGQDGPGSRRPGFGTLVEAATGFAAMNGDADRPPILPSFPLADMTSGLYAANAALMRAVPARRSRRRRPDDRRLPLRVAVFAARAAGRGARRDWEGPFPDRQSLEQLEPARVLRHERRELDCRERIDAEDGGASPRELRARGICCRTPASRRTRPAYATRPSSMRPFERRSASGPSRRTLRSSRPTS